MGSTATGSKTDQRISTSEVVTQCLLICAVFYLWTSPVIQPVKVMVVLFHELSHGLAALLSGGEVLQIAVTADEGGCCESQGGIPALIVSAGYMGSMFFGGLVLYLSKFRGFVRFVYVLLAATLGVAILKVLHDPYSRTFATALAGSFIMLGLLAPIFLSALVLRLIGTVSCLYSIFDIYWDILAPPGGMAALENDAQAFAALTGISAELVGAFWLASSIVYFVWILKIMVRRTAAAPIRGEAQPAKVEA